MESSSARRSWSAWAPAPRRLRPTLTRLKEPSRMIQQELLYRYNHPLPAGAPNDRGLESPALSYENAWISDLLQRLESEFRGEWPRTFAELSAALKALLASDQGSPSESARFVAE